MTAPTLFCPHCSADLRGEPIPAEYFEHLDEPVGSCENGSCYCLPYGNRPEEERFYARAIGVEIPGVYDGALFWQCPDCGGRWHRFQDERMRAKAEPYVSGGAEL